MHNSVLFGRSIRWGEVSEKCLINERMFWEVILVLVSDLGESDVEVKIFKRVLLVFLVSNFGVLSAISASFVSNFGVTSDEFCHFVHNLWVKHFPNPAKISQLRFYTWTARISSKWRLSTKVFLVLIAPVIYWPLLDLVNRNSQTRISCQMITAAVETFSIHRVRHIQECFETSTTSLRFHDFPKLPWLP